MELLLLLLEYYIPHVLLCLPLFESQRHSTKTEMRLLLNIFSKFLFIYAQELFEI